MRMTFWYQRDLDENSIGLLKKERYRTPKYKYWTAKDNYIVIDKANLDRIKLKSTDTLDVKEFVDKKELDPILIERT